MKVINLEGKKVKEINLPKQFSEDYHPNLIKRAVWTIQSNKRQPYGTKERAGLRYSSTLSKRRKDYKGSYGKGLSRTPRKVMWRRGTQFGYVGATAPGTRGGRKAHPPKSEKVFDKKINKKEKQFAFSGALALTASLKEVQSKYKTLQDKKIEVKLPIVFDNKILSLKSKQFLDALKRILNDDYILFLNKK